MTTILLPSFWVNPFQAAWTRGDQVETNITTCIFQFLESLGLPLLFASQGHRHVNYPQMRFPQQSQRQAAGDALVIRMRCEKKHARRVGGNLWAQCRFKTA